MALRIRCHFPTDSKLGYSIIRKSDELLYDFSDGTFKAAPVQTIAPLPELAAPFVGLFATTLTPTPVAQFTDGGYGVAFHALSLNNEVVDSVEAVMQNGDDDPSPKRFALALLNLVGANGVNVSLAKPVTLPE